MAEDSGDYLRRTHASRRAVLRAGAAGLAALFLGSSRSPETAPQAAPAAPLSTPEELKQGEYAVFLGNNIQVIYDAQDLPVGYRQNMGARVEFDKEKVIQARLKALAAGEPEVIQLVAVPVQEHPQASQHLEGHTALDALPPDVLTDEQLGQHNIHIYQTPETHLWVRQAAVEENGPFAHLKERGQEADIVLVPGLAVDQRYLEDPVYDSVRKYAPKQHDASKPVAAIRAELVEDLRKKLSEAQQQPDSQQKLDTIFEIKQDIAKAEYLYSDEDVVAIGSPRGYYRGSKDQNENAFFIPVGRRADEDILTVGVSAAGKGVAFIDRKDSITHASAAPRRTDAYPEGWTGTYVDSQQTTYATDWLAPIGHRLNHEIGHYQTPHDSETDVDRKTLDTMTAAWNRWKASGYGKNDPSGDEGYYFVFSVPPEDGGGYIITQSSEQAVV